AGLADRRVGQLAQPARGGRIETVGRAVAADEERMPGPGQMGEAGGPGSGPLGQALGRDAMERGGEAERIGAGERPILQRGDREIEERERRPRAAEMDPAGLMARPWAARLRLDPAGDGDAALADIEDEIGPGPGER